MGPGLVVIYQRQENMRKGIESVQDANDNFMENSKKNYYLNTCINPFYVLFTLK